MSYIEAVTRIRKYQIDHIAKRCGDTQQPLLGKRGIIHDAATVARIINMQAEHLKESSAGLVYQAAQLKVSLNNSLKK